MGVKMTVTENNIARGLVAIVGYGNAGKTTFTALPAFRCLQRIAVHESAFSLVSQ